MSAPPSRKPATGSPPDPPAAHRTNRNDHEHTGQARPPTPPRSRCSPAGRSRSAPRSGRPPRRPSRPTAPPGTRRAGHDGAAHAAPAGPELPAGLASSLQGYTLAPTDPTLNVGAPTDFSFRIIGPNGAPVTAFDEEHTKRLHLIVVRRDTTGFQHLHPEMAADGTWRVPLTVPAAGSYRAFADFTPTGAGPLTLGVDLAAAGEQTPVRHQPARTAQLDGYQVQLDGELVPGAASPLTLTVSPRRRAGHRPAALPGRLRPPGRAARGRPGLPARAPVRGAGRRSHRGRAADPVPGRGAQRRDLPAVPGLPARRHGAHRRVHRCPPARPACSRPAHASRTAGHR